jgi:exportin-2 (importin alpha re-exporter)
MGNKSDLFSAPETLKAFCDRIILPNIAIRSKLSGGDARVEAAGSRMTRAYALSAHEEEMFEDDPMEYIRQDLEPSTGMSCWQRSSAIVQCLRLSLPCSLRKRHPSTSGDRIHPRAIAAL